MKTESSELERSRNLLVELGLEYASEILLELLERAVHENLSLVKFLELVADVPHDDNSIAISISAMTVNKTSPLYVDFKTRVAIIFPTIIQ